MRTSHYTVTAAQVHRRAADHAQRYLQLADHGPKCTAFTLLGLLFWAASRIRSLAAACASLRRAPSDQAARDALAATLPGYAELQRRLNRALQGHLPKALLRRPQRLAIDLTLLPYYGQALADPKALYKGKRKAGTRRFFAYATAYAICKGHRYTLALRPASHTDPWEGIVRDLLREARKAGVRPGLLLLDRGFYKAAVVRYLQRARCPFVMPLMRRGKRGGGTQVFFTWKRGGWGEYTLQGRRGGRAARARFRVCVARCPGPRPGVWAYAAWGVSAKAAVRWVVATYRLRFAIESSYRQMNQGRIRTSTKDVRLRLLYVGLALLLRNVWVWLHWEVLALRRRGGRVVDTDRLPLRTMLLWLEEEVTAALGGLVLEVACQRPWPPELAPRRHH
jgi:hypothetical protein